MAIPNGVTPDGSQSAKQDDISKLTDLLINIDKSLSKLSGISAEEDSRNRRFRSMQVTKNPTVNDLIKFSNNLGLAVPAGFIMLHNDLVRLLGSENGGGMDWKAALITSIGGFITGALTSSIEALGRVVSQGISAGGEAISGVIDSASTGAVNIIDALKKTGDAGIDLLLSDEEFANSLKTDTDIQTIRKNGIKAYLRAYYANLIEPTGYSVNINDATWKLTKNDKATFASFFNDAAQGGAALIGGVVENVGRAVTNIVAEVNINDEEIDKVRTMGYTAYLRAYYANMINPLGYTVSSDGDGINGNNWVLKEQKTFSSVGKAIGNFLGGIVSGPIQQVGDAVTNTIADIPSAFAKDAIAVRVMGYSNYLRAYYANMINPLGYVVTNVNDDKWILKEQNTASSVGKAIGNFIGGIVSAPIQQVGDALTNTIADIPTSFSKEAENARMTGYASYLKAYYANMINPLGYVVDNINADKWTLKEHTTASSVGKTIGNFIGGLVGGAVQQLGDSVTNTIANIAESFKPEVDAVRANGYMAYLKAYYANMIKPLGLEISVESLNKDKWTLYKPEKASAEAIIKIITDGIGRLAAAPLEGIMRSISDLTMDAKANSDDNVQKTRAAGYRAYVRAYYLNMLESFGYTVDMDNLNKDIFTIREGGWGEGKLRGIFNNLTSDAGKGFGNVVGGALRGISEHIFDESLDSDPDVLKTKAAGFRSLLDIYYDKMADAIDDVNGNWGSDLRGYAKDALKSAFNALGNRTAEQIKSSTTVITSSYDDSAIRQQFSTLLTNVSTVITKMDAIIEKEPVTVMGGSPTPTPTVNYNELAE